MTTKSFDNTEKKNARAHTSAEENKGITREQIASGEVNFDTAEGEAFVGLNILDLAPDQSDGPFVMEGVIDKTFGIGKAAKTIGVIQAVKGTTPVQMPIAGSFMQKAKEANLQKGDIFFVKRGKDFKSKDWGTDNCKSYLLKVTFRAARK